MMFMLNHGFSVAPGEIGNSELAVLFDRVMVFAIILIIVAFVYGLYTLVFSYLRGINRYREIARRLSLLNDTQNFDLHSIEFQKEDEFGNVGTIFNQIIERLNRFDHLKTQRLKMEKQKFELLAEWSSDPILLLRQENRNIIVSYYNAAFKESFIVKSGKEGYFDIERNTLEALRDQCAESEYPNLSRFFDDDLIEAIQTAVSVISPTSLKKDFVAMNGKERYHVDKIEIVPVWDDSNEVGDILLLYRKPRKK